MKIPRPIWPHRDSAIDMRGHAPSRHSGPMTITHVYFDGGGRNGETLAADDLDPDLILKIEKGFFDEAGDYERTAETWSVGSIEHVVYRPR